MRETRLQSLGWEDPLEKDVATRSSILAWKNPMDGGAWQATVRGVAKSRTRLSGFTSLHLGRPWWTPAGQALCVGKLVNGTEPEGPRT